MPDNKPFSSAIKAFSELEANFNKEPDWLNEYSAIYIDNTDAAIVQCECGMKHVHWANNQHSDWCPVAIFELQKETKW